MKENPIRIVKDYEDILNLLRFYKLRFDSLRTGMVSMTELALKYSRNATVLECLEDDQSVGFCAFYHNDKESGRAYLSLIAVNPLFEGKGYASKLLSHLEFLCKEDGMVRIVLEVRKYNSRAIDFYLRHGYLVANNESIEDRLIMQKRLV